MIASGVLAALGGAYLSIGFLGSFSQNMTAGRGFIALAAVIFGSWRPGGALGAALLFGFSSALAQRLPAFSESGATLFQALPYVLTLIAVAGVIGRSRPPAAVGQPYSRSSGWPSPASRSGPAPSHAPHPKLSDEVELYQRTYSTLLRSSGETRLRVLEPSHRAMGSSLHPLADRDELDLGAFLYAIRRLPGRDRARAADRHGPGPGALRPRRGRPARGLGAGRGARPAAALVRRRR